MTQDEIIRMAREAGFAPSSSYTVLPMKDYASHGISYELEHFAALVAAHERERIMNEPLTKAMWERFESEVRAAEREACAKVCDDEIKSYMSKQYTTDPLGGYRERFAAEQCAAAIRSRSEK